MKLIALTAPKGTGKDTVGSIMTDMYGMERIAFADPIKRAIEAMFDLDPTIWDDRELKEQTLHESGLLPGLHASPRYMAETIGTEWGRDIIGPDVWVKAVERRVENRMREAPADLNGFVVTDLRFDNETIWTRSMGGRVVEICREGYEWDPYHPSNAGPTAELIDDSIENSNTNDWHDRLIRAVEDYMHDVWSS